MSNQATLGVAGNRPDPEWVPIRSLNERHRPRILAHLIELSPQDRYLRFGAPTSDEQIGRYVARLDFSRDEIFGIFNRRLDLIAMSQVAFPGDAQVAGQPAMAEFGVSVSPSARGRGYGSMLFDRAVLLARNRDIRTMFIHALSENQAMLKIVKKAGARVEREGSESECWLELPRDTIASHVDEVIERGAAELDYRIKAQNRHVEEFLETLGKVKAHLVDGW